MTRSAPPPSTESRRRSPKADKREVILAAALELFAERGFHGTAVPRVAERAKVGLGTIYRYFSSKEELVNALFKLHKEHLGAELLRGFPVDAPPREQFHFFFRRAAAFAKEHPRALAFLELHHHQDYLDAESRALEKRVLAPAALFFDEARRKQVTKALPAELLAALVWGAFIGLVKASWLGHIALTPSVIAHAESCCWEAIRR